MKVALLREDASVPTRKHNNDAGIDLYACIEENFMYELYPGDVQIINTGVTVEIPKGYFGWITNKSRNNFLIGGGIIDETYQGELLIKVINVTNERIEIKHGEAIAQLLLIPCIYPGVEVVSPYEIHLEKSQRGSDGGIVRQINLPGTILDEFHDGFNYDDDSNLYGDV